MPSSRGSSQPRDRTWVSRAAGRFFNVLATKESPSLTSLVRQDIEIHKTGSLSSDDFCCREKIKQGMGRGRTQEDWFIEKAASEQRMRKSQLCGYLGRALERVGRNSSTENAGHVQSM